MAEIIAPTPKRHVGRPRKPVLVTKKLTAPCSACGGDGRNPEDFSKLCEVCNGEGQV